MLKHSFERGKEEKKNKRKSINPITFDTLFSCHDGYKPFYPLQNVFFIGIKACLILCLTFLLQRQNMYFQNYFHKENRFLR